MIDKIDSITGCKNRSNIAHCDIAVFFSESIIATQNKIWPIKKAPLSPRNIFENGKFHTKKPNMENPNIKIKFEISFSPNLEDIKNKDMQIRIARPEENPLTPSIKLKEFETPDEAIIVNIIAIV